MDFGKCLDSGEVILLDGAMGTELDKRGVKDKLEANQNNPDAVIEVHRDYFRAGSQGVITNSLLLNERYLSRHKSVVDADELNRAGVALAREAASDDQFVLGDMGPSGQLFESFEHADEVALAAAFERQAKSLIQAGVDGLIVETMIDLREAVCALRACRKITDLPVVVSMVFRTDLHGGKTPMGNSAKDCASQLEGEGADAIGANCGEVTPQQMRAIVRTFRANTSRPIVASPNAGEPLWRDRTVVMYDMDPKTFADGVIECHKAGAQLVGGCCGSSPAHIKALHDKLKGL